MNNFYTYAYLREDGSPYYIGKGRGNRAYDKRHSIGLPSKSRILILKNNLTEEQAFGHEKYMIAIFGRKDLGTGILRNKTDGGEGSSNIIRTKEHLNSLLNGRLNYTFTEDVKNKISKTLKEKNIKPPSRMGIKHSDQFFDKRCKRTYEITSPSGEKTITKRLQKFCDSHNLHCGCMRDVANGNHKQYKGWTVKILSQST
jgi:hypothetical protein